MAELKFKSQTEAQEYYDLYSRKDRLKDKKEADRLMELYTKGTTPISEEDKPLIPVAEPFKAPTSEEAVKHPIMTGLKGAANIPIHAYNLAAGLGNIVTSPVKSGLQAEAAFRGGVSKIAEGLPEIGKPEMSQADTAMQKDFYAEKDPVKKLAIAKEFARTAKPFLTSLIIDKSQKDPAEIVNYLVNKGINMAGYKRLNNQDAEQVADMMMRDTFDIFGYKGHEEALQKGLGPADTAKNMLKSALKANYEKPLQYATQVMGAGVAAKPLGGTAVGTGAKMFTTPLEVAADKTAGLGARAAATGVAGTMDLPSTMIAGGAKGLQKILAPTIKTTRTGAEYGDIITKRTVEEKAIIKELEDTNKTFKLSDPELMKNFTEAQKEDYLRQQVPASVVVGSESQLARKIEKTKQLFGKDGAMVKRVDKIRRAAMEYIPEKIKNIYEGKPVTPDQYQRQTVRDLYDAKNIIEKNFIDDAMKEEVVAQKAPVVKGDGPQIPVTQKEVPQSEVLKDAVLKSEKPSASKPTWEQKLPDYEKEWKLVPEDIAKQIEDNIDLLEGGFDPIYKTMIYRVMKGKNIDVMDAIKMVDESYKTDFLPNANAQAKPTVFSEHFKELAQKPQQTKVTEPVKPAPTAEAPVQTISKPALPEGKVFQDIYPNTLDPIINRASIIQGEARRITPNVKILQDLRASLNKLRENKAPTVKDLSQAYKDMMPAFALDDVDIKAAIHNAQEKIVETVQKIVPNARYDVLKSSLLKTYGDLKPEALADALVHNQLPKEFMQQFNDVVRNKGLQYHKDFVHSTITQALESAKLPNGHFSGELLWLKLKDLNQHFKPFEFPEYKKLMQIADILKDTRDLDAVTASKLAQSGVVGAAALDLVMMVSGHISPSAALRYFFGPVGANAFLNSPAGLSWLKSYGNAAKAAKTIASNKGALQNAVRVAAPVAKTNQDVMKEAIELTRER